MKERIRDKIKQIEEFLETLLEIKPLTFEDYMRDMKAKAACERYVQKIIEAIIDLAYLVIRHKGLRMPEEDEQIFDILIKNKILSLELGKRLQDAKGMRNFLIHPFEKLKNLYAVFEFVQTIGSLQYAFLSGLIDDNQWPKIV